jgi:hypothetical protein
MNPWKERLISPERAWIMKDTRGKMIPMINP